MINPKVRCALVLGALFVAPAYSFAQNGDSLTTDDVLKASSSVTSVANSTAVPEGDAVVTTSSVASAGYTRVSTTGGYTFDRPTTWVLVQNVQSSGAPSFFKYDAIFQDPKTGAVLSAISVDRAQVQTPIDISDETSVNSLLIAMLNPTNNTGGAKIFRSTSGFTPKGAKWLRVKAQGQGQAVDGTSVDTTYWLQLLQTDSTLALVAVGYPSSQQDVVGEAAFHAVRTLEMDTNARGPAAPVAAPTPAEPGDAPQSSEVSESSMRVE